MTASSGKDAPIAKATASHYQTLAQSSLGIQFGLSIAIGTGAGYWADGRFGTKPWLTLLGLFYGSLAGFRALHRAAKQYTGSPKPTDPPEQSP